MYTILKDYFKGSVHCKQILVNTFKRATLIFKMKINTKHRNERVSEESVSEIFQKSLWKKTVDGICSENSITEMVTIFYHFEITVDNATDDSIPTHLGTEILQIFQVNWWNTETSKNL